MGVVFRAEDPKLERLVALKAMKPAFAASRSAKERFLREAKATASIEHENIVHIYQIGEDRGVPFIAMQFLRGESLHKCLAREQKIDQRKVLRIGREVAEGLAVAHDRGLIHRDIKPDNIWLEDVKKGSGPIGAEHRAPTASVGRGRSVQLDPTPFSRVKILDFGLVRAASDDAGLTRAGVVVGTPKYMAPEQAHGQTVDHRCDLFSLGSVLYHLATGKAPFAGSNVTATLMAVAQKEPEAVDKICPEIDSDLARLIMRLLSKDRDQRPQSADEVVEAIMEIEQRLAVEQAPAVAGLPTEPPGVTEGLNDAGRPAVGSRAGSGDPRPARTKQPSLAPTESLPQIVTRSVGEGRNTSTKRKRVSQSAPPRAHEGSGHTRWRFVLACAGGAALVLLAVVFFIQTKEGVIRVEINDPEIEVAIKGTEIVLHQADQGKDVALSPGDHTLVVQRGDFKFETGKLILKKGETVTVRVELLADQIQVRQGEKLIGEKRLTPERAVASLPTEPGDPPPLAIAPFDADQAKKHQQARADHLGVPVKKDVDLGGGVKITMVLIPPGEFLMGSTDEERDRWLKEATTAKDQEEVIDNIPGEGPQHRVRLTKPFYLAAQEVTQEQYQRVMGANPSHFSSSGGGKETVAGQFTNRHPVENVSWFDAVDFCNKLSTMEKRRPCCLTSGQSVTPVSGNGYRLPSEAEWEYACRAGTTDAYCCAGESELGNYAWYGVNSGGKTHPVGEKLPNGFGLRDMHGNVWEWCWDRYDAKYYEKLDGGGDVLDPFGPSAGSGRVLRGGDWSNRALFCRSAHRGRSSPGYRSINLGFRLASVLAE
ncbi:MAG: SUMF1/EgtB/PvdO family nonheme iron enzyme [Pirellulaceae bacterium]